jgi:aryl-alcohol dehydrogenase-like predicted oxidoreductase
MPPDFKISPLAFGCASIMGKVGRRESERALGKAYELGVSHFDVARSYGFGRAESVLGDFIRGKRDKVTIATKFGVVAPELSLAKRILMPVAREAYKLAPVLKRSVKQQSGELLANRCFDIGFASQCLERSLRELQTDYIDIYLIHEPSHSLLREFDLMRNFLDKQKQLGKIRSWGLALKDTSDHLWADHLDPDFLQIEGNVKKRAAIDGLLEKSSRKLVTRPFAGGEVVSGVPAWPIYLNAMAVRGYSYAESCFAYAKSISGEDGSILCAMFDPGHICENVGAMNKIVANAHAHIDVSEAMRIAELD